MSYEVRITRRHTHNGEFNVVTTYDPAIPAAYPFHSRLRKLRARRRRDASGFRRRRTGRAWRVRAHRNELRNPRSRRRGRGARLWVVPLIAPGRVAIRRRQVVSGEKPRQLAAPRGL